MKIPIFFDARPLRQHLVPGKDTLMVQAALNSFLKMCVETANAQYTRNWQEYFEQTLHDTYMQVAIESGVFQVIDHDTGNLNTRSCYEHYLRLMTLFNNYYRLDAIATVRELQRTYAVVSLRYVEHTDHYVLVAAECRGLLVYEHNLDGFAAR